MTKQWDAYESTIKDLYSKHTLTVVRQIMIDNHNFKASVRAYRGRFDLWGVHKYNCKRRNSAGSGEETDATSSNSDPDSSPTLTHAEHNDPDSWCEDSKRRSVSQGTTASSSNGSAGPLPEAHTQPLPQNYSHEKGVLAAPVIPPTHNYVWSYDGQQQYSQPSPPPRNTPISLGTSIPDHHPSLEGRHVTNPPARNLEYSGALAAPAPSRSLSHYPSPTTTAIPHPAEAYDSNYRVHHCGPSADGHGVETSHRGSGDSEDNMGYMSHPRRHLPYQQPQQHQQHYRTAVDLPSPSNRLHHPLTLAHPASPAGMISGMRHPSHQFGQHSHNGPHHPYQRPEGFGGGGGGGGGGEYSRMQVHTRLSVS